MSTPFFYHVGDIRSRHHITATPAEARHELFCDCSDCLNGSRPASELRSVLSAPATPGALGEMVDAVAAVYRVPAADLLGRSRSKAVAEARICLYLLARRCTRMSYPELGRDFNRDHTTILQGVRRAERLCAADRWIASAMAELLEQFGGETREEERMQ